MRRKAGFRPDGALTGHSKRIVGLPRGMMFAFLSFVSYIQGERETFEN